MHISYTNQSLAAFNVQRQDGVVTLTSDILPGKSLATSDRFFRSLWKTCKINEKLFRYFSSEEIFAKVVEKEGQKNYRFCIEENDGLYRVLAVSLPDAEFISLKSLLDVIQSEDTIDSGYYDGSIFSVCSLYEGGDASNPNHGPGARPSKKAPRRAGDDPNGGSDPSGVDALFGQLETDGEVRPLILRRFPVDGLGRGRLAFGVTLGDNYLFFDTPKMSYQTDDSSLHRGHFVHQRTSKATGKRTYSVLQAGALRLRSAAHSALSLGEIASFYRMCDRFEVPVEHFDELLSHPFEAYGLASYNAFSATRLSRLPTKHTVLDLFEVMALAIPSFPVFGRWKVFELAGKILAAYYDFEGTLFGQVAGEAKSSLEAAAGEEECDNRGSPLGKTASDPAGIHTGIQAGVHDAKSAGSKKGVGKRSAPSQTRVNAPQGGAEGKADPAKVIDFKAARNAAGGGQADQAKKPTKAKSGLALARPRGVRKSD